MTEATPHLQIAIVGAGFGGLGTAIRLKQQGVHDFALFERAADVGGVWRDNSYPEELEWIMGINRGKVAAITGSASTSFSVGFGRYRQAFTLSCGLPAARDGRCAPLPPARLRLK
jgi:uncharacterized protein with NAD-binding domain and iron-sulfur cluster